MDGRRVGAVPQSGFCFNLMADILKSYHDS